MKKCPKLEIQDEDHHRDCLTLLGGVPLRSIGFVESNGKHNMLDDCTGDAFRKDRVSKKLIVLPAMKSYMCEPDFTMSERTLVSIYEFFVVSLIEVDSCRREDQFSLNFEPVQDLLGNDNI